MTQPWFQGPGGRMEMGTQASLPPDLCPPCSPGALWSTLMSGLARVTARPEAREEEEVWLTSSEVPEPPFAAGQQTLLPSTCSSPPAQVQPSSPCNPQLHLCPSDSRAAFSAPTQRAVMETQAAPAQQQRQKFSRGGSRQGQKPRAHRRVLQRR